MFHSHTPDDAALVLVVTLHVEVTVVSDGEYVWRHLPDLLVGVEADLIWGVDGEQLVGIDCDEDRACVCLQGARHKDKMLETARTRPPSSMLKISEIIHHCYHSSSFRII